MSKEEGFKRCCAEHIKGIWEQYGSMSIVHYVGECPICNHFIGLTQTDEDKANEFLLEYGIEPIKRKPLI